MKKHIKWIAITLFFALAYTSCDDMDASYKDILGGPPEVYLNKLDEKKIVVMNGRERVKISWPAHSDLRADSTRIMWNNRTKYKDVKLVPNQPTEVIIEDLLESTYDFILYNFNSKGMKSVTSSVQAETYGDVYAKYLNPRTILSTELKNKILKITMVQLADETLIASKFEWTQDGEPRSIEVASDKYNDVVEIKDFEAIEFSYCGIFVPPNSMDRFESRKFIHIIK